MPCPGRRRAGEPSDVRRFNRRSLIFPHDAKLNKKTEEPVNSRKSASDVYRFLNALPTRAPLRARFRNPIRQTRHYSDTYGRGAERKCLAPKCRSAAHELGSNILE
jgi:hypothetical protein